MEEVSRGANILNWNCKDVLQHSAIGGFNSERIYMNCSGNYIPGCQMMGGRLSAQRRNPMIRGCRLWRGPRFVGNSGINGRIHVGGQILRFGAF